MGFPYVLILAKRSGTPGRLVRLPRPKRPRSLGPNPQNPPSKTKKATYKVTFFVYERVMGFEPTASTLARLRSSQLSYTRELRNAAISNGF